MKFTLISICFYINLVLDKQNYIPMYYINIDVKAIINRKKYNLHNIIFCIISFYSTSTEKKNILIVDNRSLIRMHLNLISQ